MKQIILNQTIQPTGLTIQDFTTGLVFGFDLGTASIGYAVRRGSEFLDVGVIICPEDTSDLAARRQFRSQRRRIRSQRNRKKWVREQLEKMKLQKPSDVFFEPRKDETREAYLDRVDPVRLRCRAIQGVALLPEQLHVAIAHLLGRRGYLDNPPWGNESGEPKAKEDEEVDNSPEAIARRKREEEQEKLETALKESEAELASLPEGERYVCFALKRRGDANQLTNSVRQRGINWRRKYLVEEFAKLAEMQNLNRDEFRRLLGGETPSDWLLSGSTACVDGHSVVFSKGKDAKTDVRHE